MQDRAQEKAQDDAIEVTDQLVGRIARLARLGVTPAEAAALKGHFEKVLAMVEVLDTLDLTGVDPSVFPLSTHNIFRADAVSPSLGAEEALRNSPARREGQFLVPRIVAGPGGVAEAEESA